jgi:hypothetical protein
VGVPKISTPIPKKDWTTDKTTITAIVARYSIVMMYTVLPIIFL